MYSEETSVTAPEVLVKQPGETRQFSMDFASILGTSETISTASVSGDPSGLTLGTPSISGTKVLFNIIGGTHAVRYRLQVTITTSASATLVGDGVLRVKDK